MPNQAPDDPILIRNRSASGGVNTFSSQLDIEDNQVVDHTNGFAIVPGIRGVRPGTSVVATGITHGPILAMSEFVPSTFVPELLVIAPSVTYPNAGPLDLLKWDGIAGTFTRIGALTGMTSATMPIDIIVGQDLNASGGPAVALISSRQPLDFNYYYNGSAIVTAQSRPSTGMFPYGSAVGRMFAGGRVGTSRGKVFFSDVGSFTVTGFKSTQALTMGGSARQEIVALKDYRQSDIIIFMQDRIEALQLDGDPFGYSGTESPESNRGLWSRVVIDRRIGCGARRTVQTVGQDLVFMDQHGDVRSLARTITDDSQGTKNRPLSYKIQSWMNRINGAAIETSQGAAFERFYVISIPIDSATTPSHTFVYDVINEAWHGPWIGPWAEVSSLAVATLNSASLASDKNPTLFIGGSETAQGEVYRSFVGTGDDGAPITYQETTRRETFGTLEARKMLRRARLYAFPSPGATMMVEARINGGQFKLVDYADLSGTSPQLPLTGPVDLTGSGVVEKVMTLESGFEDALDLQYRFTCTAPVDLQIIGHTTQAHLKNVDWQVT